MGTLVQPTTASSPFGSSIDAPALRLLERRPSGRGAAEAARPLPAARADWLSRLAAWAEAQPPHRHLGSWTQLR